MADEIKTKWVLPPSLYQSFNEFITLYKTLYKEHSSNKKNHPILIIGPPGVGKTLFSDVFAALYKEDNKDSVGNKIIRS